MFEQRRVMIQEKIDNLCQKFGSRFNTLIIPKIEIKYDLEGRTAGEATSNHVRGIMRFNRDMMLNESWDHMYNVTVPHELAHVLCFANKLDYKHGKYWRNLCLFLGGNGEIYHSEPVVYARGETYVYTTTTGHTIHLSVRRHRTIQNGGSYTIKDNRGRIDKSCKFHVL